MEGLFNGARFPGGLDVMVLMFLDSSMTNITVGVMHFLLDYSLNVFLFPSCIIMFVSYFLY